MSPSYTQQTENDFSRARLKAFWREVRALLSRRSNELVSFDQVRRSLKTFGENYRGVQTVPLAQIIGTATLRYNDFDSAFLPLRDDNKARWRKIDELYYADIDLPPVELYRIGAAYFVRDGHHRISVAREQGQAFIDAEVIEVKTHVPVTPALLATDLNIIGEYSDFIEKTRLDKLRPDTALRFSEPGGYARLIEHIAVHRYFLGAERREKIPWADAVASWHDRLYLPIIHAVRAQHILKDFPHRTEADLYLWIADHHYYLREQNESVGLEDAAIDFAAHYSARLDKRLLNAVKHAVAEWLAGESPKPLLGTLVDEPRPAEKESHHASE